MKLKLSLIIFSLAAVGVLTFGGLSDAAAQSKPFRTIVILEEGVSDNQVRSKVSEIGGTIENEMLGVNGVVVNLPSQARLPSLVNLPEVVRVEEDVKVSAYQPPNKCSPWPECRNNDDGGTDPAPAPAEVVDWGVDRIDADLAWSVNSGNGARVAVIDTGLDKDHPGLAGNIAGGVNFVASGKGPSWKSIVDSSDWDDDNGHGTHVGGTIAELGDETGYKGVANEASLYGVKVLGKDGSGYLSDVANGIYWSIDNNMDVINMSLGTSTNSQTLQDAVDSADAAGVVVVASAGNSGDGVGTTNEVGYPAKYSSVIAVAATDSVDGTPDWSSEGSEVEIAAPGVSITSTWHDGAYNTISGTSMASPHVTGVAALMLANNASLTNDQVRSTLRLTADDLGATGFDNFYGWGLVDAEEAVTGDQTSN